MMSYVKVAAFLMLYRSVDLASISVVYENLFKSVIWKLSEMLIKNLWSHCNLQYRYLYAELDGKNKVNLFDDLNFL